MLALNISNPIVEQYFHGNPKEAMEALEAIATKKMLSCNLQLSISKTQHLYNYKVPLKACSLSIDSNNALKLPAPNPFAPSR